MLHELGHGAMGVVYAAEDPFIGRSVAIKTIRFGTPEAGEDRVQLVQRLHREAQAAGVLSHPGIVTIHDVGEQENEAYIVMELVDGRSVEEIFAAGALPPIETVLFILKQTASAIDYAHSKGIIHRDIKPSNIMVCRDGAAKIADFGVAKLSASNALTQTGFVVGTPNYMSPEQAQGHAIDGRSDQFSLAVVAFRMITGNLPFEGPSLTALLAKILWEEPEYENAGIPPALRPVFIRALSKDPRLRFASCGDFVRDLESAFAESASQPDAARTPPTATSPAIQRGNPDFPAAVPKCIAREKKKKWPAAWAAGLGLTALALMAVFLFKAGNSPEARDPSRLVDAAAVSPPARSENAPSRESAGPRANSNQSLPPPAVSGALAPPAAKKTPVQTALKLEPAKAVRPLRVQPDRADAPGDAASALPASAAPAMALPAASGVLTWSGELQRNSILVIADQRASIGNVTGQLPGKPVKIVVETQGLIIRQPPGEANQWSQVILYSGNRSYSSITIRWSLAE